MARSLPEGSQAKSLLHNGAESIMGDGSHCVVWAGKQMEGMGDDSNVPKVSHFRDSGSALLEWHTEDVVGGSLW